MNLVGDPVGLEELKRMKAERKDFLRFLITEARTSFSRSAEFKGASGRMWKLTFDGQNDELRIEPLGGSTDRL
jgi:hypothetical protein